MIIDVRTPEEYTSGHRTGAINIPLDALKRGATLDCSLSQSITVYCRSGGRASIAVCILRDQGFNDVTNDGGVRTISIPGP